MPKLKPAKTEKEWWAILKSSDKNFIRTMDDWKKSIANPKTNPLSGCDLKAIEHFTANLKFVNGGLGHADYTQVGMQLNFFEFKKLWERFGLSLELFADHEGYACVGKGDCQVNGGHVCTSNC